MHVLHRLSQLLVNLEKLSLVFMLLSLTVQPPKNMRNNLPQNMNLFNLVTQLLNQQIFENQFQILCPSNYFSRSVMVFSSTCTTMLSVEL